MIRLSKKLPMKAANLFIFLCTIISMSGQSQSDLKLWYKAPSLNQWESALPIGNGSLGAMIYGNVATETIQLNEHTVWSGGPNRNDNPLALEALPELRKLIFDGKYKEADKMANQVIITKKSHGQMFQPVANLQIDFPGHAEFSNYHRELDLRTAIATTTYVANGVTYTREALASFTERVIAIKLKASQKGKLSFTTSYTSPHLNKKTTINGQNELVIDGKTSDHEGVPSVVNFEGISHITIKGGSLQRNDTSITVKDATEATIYISIATNFNSYNDVSGNEKLRAKQALEQASKISFDKLKKKHIKAYQSFFNRVDLDLGVAKDLTSPTDERLKKFNDNNDPQFVELYFQFGRYLLISSSQSGGQPANLQGIWNNRLNAPWDSKYTININAEMNYWPAERTNLSELHQPFLQMVKELAITGQETAKTMYGARGWVAHHNTDIWRATGAIDGARWGVWPTGGAWLSQHLWEHYLYTGDKKFLEEIYPTIKGAATFFVDFLIEHPKFKWLVVTPSTSPENAPKEYDDIAVNAGVTMDNQLVFEIFSTTIRAAEILGVDKQFMDTLKMKRALLPPMQIGQHNQLQEWLEDLDDPNDKHRHISHLYGLFPANQISPFRTPKLFEAARNTLIQRGDVSTDWSMGWKVNWWARLLDGNHAYVLIQKQLTPLTNQRGSGGTYTNLFDAHPPFQIDGNFGCTSGIAEMLMQCSDEAVHLLPALPDVWKDGSIKGLMAKGGFEITNLQWENQKIVKLEVVSHLGGNLRLRLPNAVKLNGGGSLATAQNENPNMFYKVDQVTEPIISSKSTIKPSELDHYIMVDVPTKKGKKYSFTTL